MVKSDEDEGDNGGDKNNINNINNNNNNISNNKNNNINKNFNNYYETRTRADQIEYRKKNLLKCFLLHLNNNL